MERKKASFGVQMLRVAGASACFLFVRGSISRMYLMYVDDSGDCGMPADGSPSNLFCLSGLVVHELRWRDTLSDLAAFRRWLWARYKINIEDEIHAADMKIRSCEIHESRILFKLPTVPHSCSNKVSSRPFI
jgi:hypothetical protein